VPELGNTSATTLSSFREGRLSDRHAASKAGWRVIGKKEHEIR